MLLAAVEGWLSVLNSVCLSDLQAESVTCMVEDAEGETGGLSGVVVFVMFTESGCSVVVLCRSKVFPHAVMESACCLSDVGLLAECTSGFVDDVSRQIVGAGQS